MPTGLKARFFGWIIYWLLVAWLLSQGMLLGIVLLVIPGFWWVAKAWFQSEVLGADLHTGNPGLASYTLDYVWGSSFYLRCLGVVTLLAAALGGLGWVGTEEMRTEAAKPTVGETVSSTVQSAKDGAAQMAGAARDKAADAAEGTMETTRGWYATAKGWFTGEN